MYPDQDSGVRKPARFPAWPQAKPMSRFCRAVNVGGVKLPMTELRIMCEEAGFESVRTYIASGNVIFESDDDQDKIRDLLRSASRISPARGLKYS